MKDKFIPKAKGKKVLTKAEIKLIHPSARYSGKTVYDTEGQLVRGPGYYV